MLVKGSYNSRGSFKVHPGAGYQDPPFIETQVSAASDRERRATLIADSRPEAEQSHHSPELVLRQTTSGLFAVQVFDASPYEVLEPKKLKQKMKVKALEFNGVPQSLSQGKFKPIKALCSLPRMPTKQMIKPEPIFVSKNAQVRVDLGKVKLTS